MTEKINNLSKSWINYITKFYTDENRISKGKSYSNDGMIKEVKFHDGLILAKIKGSNSSSYQLRFKTRKLNENELNLIKNHFCQNMESALNASSDNFANELINLFNQNNINIFEDADDNLTFYCTCQDPVTPCKHTFALLIELGEYMQNNPYILLNILQTKLSTLLEESGFNDIIEEVKNKDITSKFLAPSNVSTDFDSEKYLNIKSKNSIQLPETPIDTIFSILDSNPDFSGGSDFKQTLFKIYQSIGEGIELITANTYNSSFKDANFHLYYTQDGILKAFITPSTQFLYYLRSKGSRVQYQTPITEIPVFNEETKELKFIEKDGVSVTYDILFDYLLSIEEDLTNSSYSYSSKFLGYIKNLSLAIIKSGSYIPDVSIDQYNRISIKYIPLINNERMKLLLNFCSEIMPLNFAFKENENLVLDKSSTIDILSLFITYIIHKSISLSPTKHKNGNLINLFTKNRPVKLITQEEKNNARSIINWLDKLGMNNKDINFVIRIDTASAETKQSGEFFLLNVDITSKSKPIDTIVTLSKLFSGEYTEIYSMPINQVQKEILQQLKSASQYIPELKELIISKGNVLPIINIKQLLEIISQNTKLLNLLGIRVIIPKELKNLITPKLRIKAKYKNKNQNAKSTASISNLSIQDLLDFSYEISIGDETISKEEFLKLVDSANEIVKYKDSYIILKPEEVNAILQKHEEALPVFHSSLELLHCALTGSSNNVEFDFDEAFNKVLEDLTKIEDIDIPETLNAELRPYQTRGFKWLYSNSLKGFGSCIADDMGLGKTIQVISLILKLKEENNLKNPALVVCPTTLVGNWEKECQRFAPSLKVSIYHGLDRKLTTDTDILITTYGLLRSDIEDFKKIEWDFLIIDEAQNIKNNDTGQTAAVKSVKAKSYIAMSGTPVENRLTELWSIFDFVNKGYLGTVSEFQRAYSIPIEKYREEDKIEKLKKATAPFVLRRLKTDKTIIDDLPEKIEFDEYCYLTKEQAALYEKVLDSSMKAIETAEGINRRGNILKLITALKQICNHPAHYTRKDSLKRELSGKTEKVFSILETIFEQNEKVLIFTQYKEMGDLLSQMVKAEFGHDPLFFHGSLTRQKREEIVEKFQTDDNTKLMIISLKAGGTGLNLTAAANVIHYDLWWNPAVEQQATDRAYRIGQDKNVIVHRMITIGTFEEKIDEIIKSKKELAQLTVSTGENWITELSNKDLRELLSLSL